MRILLGTTNPGKAARLRYYLRELSLEVLMATDHAPDLAIEEAGETPEENARIKAASYYGATGIRTLAEDAALEIQGLDADDQPGALVRRVGDGGVAVSDREMVTHYAGLLRRLGGQTEGVWTSGVAVATERGVRSRTLRSTTLFVPEPSDKIVDGQPLRSLQIDPSSGRYLSEMTDPELDVIQGERATGVAPFVRECLGMGE